MFTFFKRQFWKRLIFFSRNSKLRREYILWGIFFSTQYHSKKGVKKFTTSSTRLQTFWMTNHLASEGLYYPLCKRNRINWHHARWKVMDERLVIAHPCHENKKELDLKMVVRIFMSQWSQSCENKLDSIAWYFRILHNF